LVWKLIYHPDVKAKDIPLLDSRFKIRIKTAIETRLAISPHQYGQPLRKTLKGYWKLRVGDYRVVFRIAKSEVWIFGIIHRKDVYKKIRKRV
jgi:mRNA interferase RelE/StbE